MPGDNSAQAMLAQLLEKPPTFVGVAAGWLAIIRTDLPGSIELELLPRLPAGGLDTPASVARIREVNPARAAFAAGRMWRRFAPFVADQASASRVTRSELCKSYGLAAVYDPPLMARVLWPAAETTLRGARALIVASFASGYRGRRKP
ncbi:MAG: hypothetical protein WDN31_05245 [Hyphomicrobium sp.]